MSVQLEYPLSKYQKPIMRHILTGSSHLLVNAKAGAGKTSTIKVAIQYILDRDPTAKVLFLAFNSAIKKEARDKLPRLADVMTCHGAGLRAIRTKQKIGEPDQNKTRKIVQGYLEEIDLHDMPENDVAEKAKRLIKLANLIRLTLNKDCFDLADRFGIEIMEGEGEEALEVVKRITNDHTSIDFTDMIYRPAVFDAYRFEQYDYVFVDECQDLSVAQQRFVKKLVKDDGMMVFVGDPNQAVYGFAGADADSFKKLEDIPGIIQLPLNECYRCGSDIIELAQTIVPEIEAHPITGKGKVDQSAKLRDIKAGDMVLCRQTLPLVTLCYKLIGEGRNAYVKGKNIGKTLADFIEKSNTRSISKLMEWMDAQPIKAIQRLRRLHPGLEIDELKEKQSYRDLEERIKIIKLIASNPGHNTVGAVKQAIYDIFDNDGEGVCLATIHKSKGLENERVFILDRKLMPSPYAKKAWELEQERNLEYVAYTRAKGLLGFISDYSGMDAADTVLSSPETMSSNPNPGLFVENINDLF